MDETSTEVVLSQNPNSPPKDSLSLQRELKDSSSIKKEQYTSVETESNAKKSKGTKRKASVDLQLYTCEVCQVKLNSASQAYQHFQGKTHRGKVKMLEMAAEVQPPSANVITTTNTSTIPNSTTTSAQDVPAVLPTTLEHYCALCQKIFNSKNQAEQHFSGKAHKHKQSENAIANIQGSNVKMPHGKKDNVSSGVHTSSSVADVKLGGNVKSELFSCHYCHITLNSERQFEQHVNGLRHKIIVGKAKPPPPPQAEEPGWQEIRYKKLTTAISTVGLLANCGNAANVNAGGTRLGQYYCKDCDVSVNSPLQLQQHLTSPRHKAKLDGTVVVKKKPTGRGRGGQPIRGSFGTTRGTARGAGRGIGRGTGRGRGIPSLSSNFVKGGEMKPYQPKPVQSAPATQFSSNAALINTTIQNNQNNGYMSVMSYQSSNAANPNSLHNSYPVHSMINYSAPTY